MGVITPTGVGMCQRPPPAAWAPLGRHAPSSPALERSICASSEAVANLRHGSVSCLLTCHRAGHRWTPQPLDEPGRPWAQGGYASCCSMLDPGEVAASCDRSGSRRVRDEGSRPRRLRGGCRDRNAPAVELLSVPGRVLRHARRIVLRGPRRRRPPRCRLPAAPGLALTLGLTAARRQRPRQQHPRGDGRRLHQLPP